MASDGSPQDVESGGPTSGSEQRQAQALVRNPSADSLTPSVRDLLDHGPGLVETSGWKGFFCLHLTRLKATNVGECKLLPWEDQLLITEMGFGNRTAQFSVWRSTLLHVGAFFFTFITVIDVLFVADIWGTKGEESLFMRRVDPRYRDFFSGLNTCNWLQSIGLLLSNVVAVGFACAAAVLWRNLKFSRRLVFGSWISSYLPPFLLLLAIPYGRSVNFEGIQKQMCRDMLDVGLSVQNSSWWPGRGGKLAQTLLEAYSLSLPADFCEDDPIQWGPRIRSYLTDQGFLATSNGSCGFADFAIRDLDTRVSAELTENGGRASLGPVSVTVGTSDSDCPPDCLNCTSSCRPHLLRLAALGSIHDPSLLGSLPLGGIAEHCVHCISRAAELLCPFRCPSVGAELDLQAVLGMIPTPGRACFDPTHVADFELLMQLGTQTAYWRAILGSVYAALSLTILLPLAFSLMLGAGKGAWIAKSIIPYSRVPNVISTSAAVFSFPFVFMLMILVQNAFGDWLTLIAIVLVLIAFLASMKPGSLKAETTAQMHQRADFFGKIGLGASVAALLVFLVVVLVSDLSSVLFDMLRDQSLTLTSEDFRKLSSHTTWTVVNTVCTVFGKSLVSTVFFGDSVVLLMYGFHKGQDTDAFSIQCARTKLVEDLDTALRGCLNNCQAVAPADEARPAVTTADLVDQQRAQMVAKMKTVASDSKLTARLEELEKVHTRVVMNSAAQHLGSQSSEARSSSSRLVKS